MKTLSSLCHLGLLGCCLGIVVAPLAAAVPAAGSIWAHENIHAWSVAPFDSVKRTPEERLAMLQRLGLKHYAYSWREVNIPTFEAEIIAAKQHGIALLAWNLLSAEIDEAPAKAALEADEAEAALAADATAAEAADACGLAPRKCRQAHPRKVGRRAPGAARGALARFARAHLPPVPRVGSDLLRRRAANRHGGELLQRALDGADELARVVRMHARKEGRSCAGCAARPAAPRRAGARRGDEQLTRTQAALRYEDEIAERLEARHDLGRGCCRRHSRARCRHG